MNRYSAPLVVRKMPSKTTRCYFTHFKMAMIKKIGNKKYRHVEKLQPSYTAGGNVK